MHRKGHLGITLAFSAPFILFLRPLLAVLIITPLYAFSTIPDKDQHFKFIPGINHRGITHTFLFALLCGVIGGGVVIVAHQYIWEILVEWFGGSNPPKPNWGQMATFVGVGSFLGIFTHILGDVITVGSRRYNVLITPYWPISKRAVRFGWCYAADKRWNWGLLFLGLTLFGAAVFLKVGSVAGVSF